MQHDRGVSEAPEDLQRGENEVTYIGQHQRDHSPIKNDTAFGPSKFGEDYLAFSTCWSTWSWTKDVWEHYLQWPPSKRICASKNICLCKSARLACFRDDRQRNPGVCRALSGVGIKYDMLVELLRREKNAGIKPDEDLDVFMKALALEGRQTSLVAEYIMKVLSKKDQQQYWCQYDYPYQFVSVTKFAEAFKTFVIESIPVWWIWGYWISPMMYAQNAISVNEFHGRSWSKPFADQNITLGEAVLTGYGLFKEKTNSNKDSKRKSDRVALELRSYLHSTSLNGLKLKEQKGMVLPFQPLSMCFKNINYYVDVPEAFVEEVMELVELNPLSGALVGLPGVNGLSTEQRKRLTIAVELVANPSIVFMDEPTSGLDARDGYNPAAWMLDVTSTQMEQILGVDFAEYYRQSKLFLQTKEIVEALSKPNSEVKELTFSTKYAQPFCAQFIACLWKQNLSYWRNPQYTAVRFFYTVIISLMFGTICWKFGSRRETQHDIFNAMGAISEVLVVPLLHVLHSVVLHLLRHDDNGDHSEPYGRAYHCRSILHAMESLLRVHDPKKADPGVVEVVLLGQPGVLDAVRAPDLPVRRPDQPLLLADGIRTTTVVAFLEEHFGFRHDFLGVVATMVVGFCVLFAVVFASPSGTSTSSADDEQQSKCTRFGHQFNLITQHACMCTIN
ncbi:hypothetical protein ZWY2020_032705 [Hordeum vulgare]|nr:hypothetical protein ZWY2020_032705 [Hordeum vulgare]